MISPLIPGTRSSCVLRTSLPFLQDLQHERLLVLSSPTEALRRQDTSLQHLRPPRYRLRWIRDEPPELDGWGAEQRAYCGWLKNTVKSARRQQIHTQRKLYGASSSGILQAQQSQERLASRISPVEVIVPETAPYQLQTPWTDPGPPSSSLKADPLLEYLFAQPLDWETDTELFSHGLDEGDLGGLGCTMSQEYFDSLTAEAQQHRP